MNSRLPIAITAILTACGAATTSANNSSSESTGLTDTEQSRGSGNQGQPMDDSLKAFADLQDAVDSGGIPGCFDPALSGRERAVAERLGGVPCETATPKQAPAGAAASTGFDGYWRGNFDGGSGSAIIARQNSGRYGVQVDVAGDRGCGGSVQGQASVQAGRLVMTAPIPDQGGQCRITFTRRGSALAVEEDGCMYFHGRSCGFSGSLTSRESNDLAPPEDHSE